MYIYGINIFSQICCNVKIELSYKTIFKYMSSDYDLLNFDFLKYVKKYLPINSIYYLVVIITYLPDDHTNFWLICHSNPCKFSLK